MKKTNKGFSLVELIIVIAIMAILIGVLAPQYIKYVEKSRKSADEDNADNLKNAVMTACTDEDYINSINSGDSAFIDGTHIDPGNLATALGEYFSAYTSVKLKSKTYKDSKYVVTVVETAGGNGSLSVIGEWQSN